MVWHARIGALATSVVLGAGSAAADPPVLPVPEGAALTARVERQADRYDIPVAPFGGAAEPTRMLNGHVIWEGYRMPAGEDGLAGVMAAYRELLRAGGWEILLDCTGAACGGLDFRFGVALLPPPQMVVDAAAFAQLSARRPGGQGAPVAWASVLASRALGRIHIQTVRVEAAAVAALPAPLEVPPEAPAPEVTGGTELPHDAAAETGGGDAAGGDLLARLTADGHVPVEGLSFDTGGARLGAASAPALDGLARLLDANPALEVLIVGHSDNEGSLATNRALSKRRAEAVRQALIARGVAAGRMEAAGIGFLAPRASNATPEGRARNRRVEIVLR
ncbi:OmpA family protein [Paralimibaculum aggregatum]|uniref:OmpA family protein n=1 Tax=Paralimibaculum aggregatum TaxID=3036245 RepID=A0ABQ6LMW3_9RHOB|nr:OmpA family protein [Limibaculum sp. NKW23]GMG84327.1 OmpA family protein [Limibaculum sp. NKW23]